MLKAYCIFTTLAFFLMIPPVSALAQNQEQVDLNDGERWILPHTGVEVVEYKGTEALRLKPGPGERLAYLKDCEFENGTIELDIAAIPYYTGLAFRISSEHVYEVIYFRPQNSRHEDPVRRDRTVQYVSSPRYPWYYLREKCPEEYEAAADLPPEEWFHVKLVVDGEKAEVFINDSPTPSLVIEDLKHGTSKGSVGLWAGNTSAGTFANLKITHSPSASDSVVEVKLSPEQEYFFDVFKSRRSVRRFKSTPVPDEHIMKILDIARSGPTSGNQQPWKFLVVTDPDKIAQMKNECIAATVERAKSRPDVSPDQLETIKQRFTSYIEGYLSAPVYVVVLVDKNSRYPSYNVFDGAIAASYLMVAARALGYGTVYITDSVPDAVTRKVLEIPDNFERICITPIGVPESWPQPPNKLPLGDVVAFHRLIEGINYVLPVKRTEIKLDPEALKEYVGKYEIDRSTSITVSAEDNRMYLQVTGQNRIEIFAEARDKFFLKTADVLITFQRSDDGKITQLTIHQGSRETPAKKIE